MCGDRKFLIAYNKIISFNYCASWSHVCGQQFTARRLTLQPEKRAATIRKTLM
jgi:hypothetical protein